MQCVWLRIKKKLAKKIIISLTQQFFITLIFVSNLLIFLDFIEKNLKLELEKNNK